MEEEKDKLMSGNVVINVTILDRKFKYTIPQEDESLIRNTIKGLSEKLSDFEKARVETVLGDVQGNIQLLDSQLDEYIENNVE